MSNIGSYTSRSFSENQKFLVLDPSTGTTSLVLGSDLVSYITPQLNAVNAESTRLAAENTDYAVGEIIQTSGSADPGDNFAAVYLVVEGGTGDFPMINGNDLLTIRGDEFLREQLAEDPDVAGNGVLLVSSGMIYRNSVADIESLPATDGLQVSLSGLRAGTFIFDSSNLSTEVTSDTEQGIYIAPDSDATGASGAWVRQFIGEVRPEWFGAIADNATDSTLAIQAAMDFVNADGKVLFSEGFYLATNLSIDTGVQLQGAGSGVTYVKQVSGETTPLLQDKTSGQNILIYDMAFDGNNNTITDGIVNLGFGGVQFGTVAMMKNLYIQNVVGTGVKVNGNVCQLDTLELVNCTIGLDLRGVGNLCTNLISANCTDIGINVQGARNILRGVYGEGETTTAVLNIANDSVGTSISDFDVTGVGSNIHGAGIKIGTNCFLTTVKSAVASVTSSANLANGLIYDLTTGTRKVYGDDFAGQFFHVPIYTSGSSARLHFISSVPPTIGSYLQGDWFAETASAPGFPVKWVCAQAGSPGTWQPVGVMNGAIAKTVDETLTTADNGKRFSNSGAGALVTLTLPAAFEGARYYFTRRNASFALRIEPGGSFLAGGGFGKYVSLDTDGASVQIEYLTANTYVITSESGTTSFEP